MSNLVPLTFPSLELFQHYGGDFKTYFSAIYNIFENHFIKNKTLFQGVHVTAKALPLVDGIHNTFYHITHEGEDEDNRTPDFRRMERIRYPEFMIVNSPNDDLLIWKNKRGRDTKIVILNESEEYVVVLTERPGYNLFCTAYYIDKEHRKRKLMKEYQEYINAKTA